MISAVILANWNFPNKFSINLALSCGATLSSATCKSLIINKRFPASLVVISLILIPKSVNAFVALVLGLIRDAIADLIALAPSAAGTPASFRATIIAAKSL